MLPRSFVLMLRGMPIRLGTNSSLLISWERQKNQGTVSWSPETLSRLERVPPAIRAMARVELERTALGAWNDRGDGLLNGGDQSTVLWVR